MDSFRGASSKFVAAGWNGTLMYSDNGTNFIKGNSIGDVSINSICYGNGKFVAVGTSGEYAYSNDSLSFTQRDVGERINWSSICYGNGKFVTVGDNGKYAISYNYTNFYVGSVIGNNYHWSSICYGNGKFVTVGYGEKYAFAYLDDNFALSFKERPITNGNWTSICYGNGKFVAVGEGGVLAHSESGDGFTPGSITGGNDWASICYGNGKFVAVGGNMYAYSDDGINFKTGTIPDNTHVYEICYGNGKFVAVGTSGNYIYSDDGTTFYTGSVTGIDTLYAICYAEQLTPSSSGLTFYTNSSNYAHIFANGKDILPNIPSNPVQTSQTITHEAPFTSSIENYSLRKPVYATGTVKSFNKESSTWTDAITNIDCICELKPSGTPDEFVGILVAYVDQKGTYTQSPTNARALLFATHGDFLFDVPSTENIKVGDLISINGESIPDHTILTAKINNIIIGRCTSILNNNTISILKD